MSDEKTDPRRMNHTSLVVERIDEDTLSVTFDTGEVGQMGVGGSETFKIPQVGGRREFKARWPR